MDELLKNKISKDEMIQYLTENNIDDTMDMNKHHIESFNIMSVGKSVINLNINYKSNKSQRKESFINGHIVSIDFLIVKTQSIYINVYLNFIRSKKLSKIKNGIL